MKRIVIMLTILCVFAGIPVFAEDSIKVTVNGVNIEMKEPPVIINGRTDLTPI